MEFKRVYFEPSPSSSFEHFLFSDSFAFHYEDPLQPVDFPVLVELNGGVYVDMLLFGLVPRVFRSR
jgi:hypothetical protein